MCYSQLLNMSSTKSYLDIENMLLNMKNKYPLYHNDMLDKKINFSREKVLANFKITDRKISIMKY